MLNRLGEKNCSINTHIKKDYKAQQNMFTAKIYVGGLVVSYLISLYRHQDDRWPNEDLIAELTGRIWSRTFWLSILVTLTIRMAICKLLEPILHEEQERLEKYTGVWTDYKLALKLRENFLQNIKK